MLQSSNMSSGGVRLALQSKHEQIVISGMSGKLPNSNSVAEFMERLFRKEDLCDEDLLRQVFSHPEIPKVYGTMNDLEQFDNGFFGIHTFHAKFTCPMTRLIVEQVVGALLDAGIHPDELAGSRTAVFIGACASEYESIKFKEKRRNTFLLPGTTRSIIAHRVSYFLRLNGPSTICDTACSSSMYALDHAYRAILEGRCDRAIIGGTNIVLDGFWTLQFARLGVLNYGTGCRPFDNDAAGYTRSEAIVAIILQKRCEAKRVYAEVVHVKSSADGYKPQGITFPSADGQISVLTEAYHEADIRPADMGYIEAHGTGTIVGDIEELNVLESFFAPTTERPLLIGSVKGNIGHTEASSGVCSIVKVACALNDGLIAPNIHYDTPRDGVVALIDGRVKVVTEITPFPDDQHLAGVNCFGFGGANVHAIFRRYKNQKLESTIWKHTRLVCYSARNQKGIDLLQENVHASRDIEFLALLQESFKVPIKDHLFVGFSLVGTELSSCRPVEYRERGELIVVFGRIEKNNNFQNVLEIPLLHNIYKEAAAQSFGINSEVIVYAVLLKAFAVLSLQPKLYRGGVFATFFQKCLSKGMLMSDLMNLFTSQQFKSYQHQQEALMAKNCTILLLGDGVQVPRSSRVLHFGNNMTSDDFLSNIGRLYEYGFNPIVNNLYDPITFPVARGTAMISQLIGWKTTTLDTPRFGKVTFPGIEKREPLKCHEKPEIAFYRGHLIDNRNIFPATGYLWRIWEMFADFKCTHPDLLNVLFQNVRFHRACSITPKTLDLYLVIHPSGAFEVSENNALIVSGSISELTSYEDHTCEDQVKVFQMNSKDVYKELRLRGYNYRGLFRSVQEIESSTATIKWENWATFLDGMMQVCILQKDSRSLFIPVGVERIAILAREHLKSLENDEEKVVKVEFSQNSQTIRSKYVEMRGLHATSIAKRKERQKAVLERYQFVPNEYETDLSTSIRINMQLLLECKLGTHWPMLEVLSVDDKLIISEEICRVVDDLPLILPNMSVLTENDDFQMENVTIVKTLTDRYLLLICKNPDMKLWACYEEAILDDGFLLCICSDGYSFHAPSNFILFTTHLLKQTNDVVYFLRKRRLVDGRHQIVDISSLEPIWLSQLQCTMAKDSNVVLLAENLDESGILGLTNCLRVEPGGERIQCVFIQDKKSVTEDCLSQQIDKQMPINVYQQGQWGTYRHLLLPQLPRSEPFHWFAAALSPGEISSVKWLQGPITAKNYDTMKPIKVLYSALNFRDLMLVSGKLSADTIGVARAELSRINGFEFSGIDYNGKRVMGLCNGAISNYVNNPLLLMDVPSGWEMDDAATVFVVYATVLMAFAKVGTLRQGQSILIHSGAGGVGLCALNICTYYKMDIFVTVGTEEKRTYLLQQYPNLKASHIGCSRDISFKEMIRTQTNGRGVDIVLNSLTEEKLQASVECLASGGWFLEIGKYDMTRNYKLPIDLARKGCTYQSLMFDYFLMTKSETEKAETLKAILSDALMKGYLKPLPKKVFQVDELEQAFRFMSSGKHIGKLLIQIDHNRINTNVVPCLHFYPTCSYIVFGGLGGFGLELADWLVVKGVRNLVLSSRRGITTGYQAYRISIWKSYGVNVIISTDDTSTFEKCSRVVKEINSIARIDGIFNLAVVLKDGVFKNQTMDSMRLSMMAKADLTRNLDTVSREMCLELSHFVVFSSVSCGRGNAGQTNYGYANSVMERICERRSKDGLRGLAIQWGAVGDVGLLEDLQKEQNEIAIGGTLQQKIGHCLTVLEDLMMRHAIPVVSSMVVAEKFAKSSPDSPLEAVKVILGISDIKSVSPHATFPELGMDSMMAVEIRQTLERDFDILVGPSDLRTLTFATIEDLNMARDRTTSERRINEDILGMFIPSMSIDAYARDAFLDFNVGASKETGDFILVFLGIEADFSRYEKIAQSINRYVKCVNIDAITKDYERTEFVADYVIEALFDEVRTRKRIQICSHSMGCIPAIEVTKRFEENGVDVQIVFIESSPRLIGKMLNIFKSDSVDEFHYNVLLATLVRILPSANTGKLKELVAEGRNFSEKVDITLQHYAEIEKDRMDQLRSLALDTMAKLLSVEKYDPQYANKLKANVILYKPTIKVFHDLADNYDLDTIFETVQKIQVFEGNHQTILDNVTMIEQLSIDLRLQ